MVNCQLLYQNNTTSYTIITIKPFESNNNKSDIKRRICLGCQDQYTGRGLSLLNSCDREAPPPPPSKTNKQKKKKKSNKDPNQVVLQLWSKLVTLERMMSCHADKLHAQN